MQRQLTLAWGIITYHWIWKRKNCVQLYYLLGDIPNIQVYLDDILITSNGTFEEHAAIMEQVLDSLQKANFRANLRKCYFGESKIDYLGYEIIIDGIQPQP
jgi:hypothetical protein